MRYLVKFEFENVLFIDGWFYLMIGKFVINAYISWRHRETERERWEMIFLERNKNEGEEIKFERFVWVSFCGWRKCWTFEFHMCTWI